MSSDIFVELARGSNAELTENLKAFFPFSVRT